MAWELDLAQSQDADAVDDVPLIAALQGASTAAIQAMIVSFVSQLPVGVRVAGVVEEESAPSGATADGSHLRSLVDGRVYPIFQDLGPNSTACGLDGESIVTACEAVLRDLAEGCDILVLSKFGRLESERTGLAAAFSAAAEIGTPVLTSVAPKFDEAWRRFADPCFVMLPADPEEIAKWWRTVSGDR